MEKKKVKNFLGGFSNRSLAGLVLSPRADEVTSPLAEMITFSLTECARHCRNTMM